VAAVTLGACIVEKHFTLSRSAPGPGQCFLTRAARIQGDGRSHPRRREGLGRVSYDASKSEASQPRISPLPYSLFET